MISIFALSMSLLLPMSSKSHLLIKRTAHDQLHSTRDGLKFVPFFPSISYIHPKEITYLIDFSFCLLIFRKI